ncbi:MAG: aminodeoxychorismate synthase component I [Acidiferrobacterales bacterium]
MSIPTAQELVVPSGFVARSLDVFPDLLELQRAKPKRYPHLLESAAAGTPHARYDILFAFPRCRLWLTGDQRLMRDDQCVGVGDFLEALDREWCEHARPAHPLTSWQDMLPFTGGWFVYLGYELVTQIEAKLKYAPTVSDMLTASLTRIPAAIIRDHQAHMTHLVCESADADQLIPQMERDLQSCTRHYDHTLAPVRVAEEDPEVFLAGVERILAYIRAGDVFQVNLSRPWHAWLDEPMNAARLYECLRAANPAPFAGLMTLDPDTAIVSSSPERLVRVSGRHIYTRPIAGTYPRSGDRLQDLRWSEELLRHPKERAEHVMLIDLERNDLGRVCRAGSVEVNELMVLESYRHVHHIVSEVTGVLREDITPAQIIRAVFPGGTITGCPKVRCMEIIAELEQAPRGPYTGSMGYLNRDGSMDLNILIRTMVLQGDHVQLRAGAGIVADSRPMRELRETRAKAKGLLAALGCA